MDYTIPRGIKVKETVAYGLNGKQIIYLGIGIGGALSVFVLPLPLDIRIAGAIVSTVGSLALSLTKVHGQELDRYVYNSVKYPLRNKEWSDDVQEKPCPIIIRYHSKQFS